MIIAKPIDTAMVEQSMATPVQGSPAWRRMMTGRKMNRTNSHKARVERRASVPSATRSNGTPGLGGERSWLNSLVFPRHICRCLNRPGASQGVGAREEEVFWWGIRPPTPTG